MAHLVKCKICGLKFDRDKVAAVKVSANRYAHYECSPNGEKIEPIVKVDEDLVKLQEYIKNLLGDDYNHARVKKQIKDYVEKEGYSYSGILKSLIYFYEIKGNSKEKANGGIGIVPYVYKDAYNYYYSLYLAKLMNESKNIEDYKPKEVIIEIESPRTQTHRIKLFDLDKESE